MNQDNIVGATITYGRKTSPQQYESLTAELTVTVREGADLEITLEQLETMVETRIAAAAQKRESRVKFWNAMFKLLHVPVEDVSQALFVLGLIAPLTVSDYLSLSVKIQELAEVASDSQGESLPDGWRWWMDGRHPHPRLLQKIREGNVPFTPLSASPDPEFDQTSDQSDE